MGRRVTGRRTAVTAAAAAALLGLAGCTTPGGGEGSSAPTGGGTAPADQQALAKFYGQKLTWERCDSEDPKDTTCAWLEVPIDYAKPDDGTTRLRMLRVASKGKTNRALFVNPGGPGGSATDYARSADWVVSPDLRRRFDVIGVDPRGVGESEPITCVDDAAVDEMVGADPTPDDQAERDRLTDIAKRFGKACEQKYPKLLPHVSTVDAAKDLDVARAVLGQQKFDYIGKSYGTFIGATYAGLFPTNTGHMVLDGAMAPDLTDDEMNLGQAQGFETATRAWAADCVAQGDCPLGNDTDSVMAGLRQFLKDVDAKPIPVKGDPRVKELTEGWASTGIAKAMYEQGEWDLFTDAIRAAKKGDGTDLFELAREYADRDEQGKYAGNIMQVISAVNCLDRGAQPPSDDELKARTERFAKEAPTWGPFMMWASTTCESWPVKPVEQPHKVSADGSGPILVVGTTRDPATPYSWAQRLADQLKEGRLLTFEGDGHTAYLRGSQCIDTAVDAFVKDGKVPAEGTRCKPDTN